MNTLPPGKLQKEFENVRPVDALSILDLTCEELADEIQKRHGKDRRHAVAKFYRRIFKNGRAQAPAASEPDDSGFIRLLAAEFRLPELEITAQQKSDGVVKFGIALEDGAVVEAVIIPAGNRKTLCVSSQVGCAMGCRFCETGRMGFVRQLTASEIVWQAYAARFILGHDISNVVFMGMGEPLNNFDAVTQAIRVLADPRGMNIACRHITLSTAGLVDGIQRLALLGFPNLRLAVSLHAATDSLRSSLMPINRKYPLARLKEALLAYPLEKNGVFLIEYVLLEGVNDAREHAHQLAGFLEGLPVRINLISYNAGHAPAFSAPNQEQVRRFQQWLVEKKLFVRVRLSRGQNMMAACGQLATAFAPVSLLRPLPPGRHRS